MNWLRQVKLWILKWVAPMDFHFKHKITHSDKAVSEKVNFFADIFHFTHSTYGDPGFSELENHRSLLEKIKFQLDNYSSHSGKFLKYYFQNSYLSNGDFLINNFYKDQWKKINNLKIEVFNDFSNESRREYLNSEITLFISELNNTLFQNSLDKIITAILCEKGLKHHDHIKVFEYYTPLLVSEFIFQGFPKKDLEKVFERILVKDVELTNSKVETDAPIPQNIWYIRDSVDYDPDAFYNAVNEYLQKRNLKQQFEGVYHLFKTSLKAKTYLFHIIDLEAYKPITLNYNDVIISNELTSNYVKENTRKEYKDFFEGEGRLFAEVTIKENNDDVGKANAMLKIKNAINFLNATLDRRAKIESNDYIIKDRDLNFRNSGFGHTLHLEQVGDFVNSNPYEFFKGKTNRLIERFLNLDAVYFQAENDDRSEARVVHYWRFIESFFEPDFYDAVAIRKIVSEILSKRYSFALSHFSLAHGILWPAYRDDPHNITGINSILNISSTELVDLMKPSSFKQANFRRYIEVINHPYVTRRLKWYLESDTNEKFKVVNDFYAKVLLEVYEQRNFIEHSGIHNKYSVEKVLFTLPEIASKFRILIISELKDNEYKSFKELIEHLNSN
jgi:hypothetical protein